MQDYLRSLELFSYRNFSEYKINFGCNLNILSGHNGAGKTNIIESISLLQHSKGLRNITLSEIHPNNQKTEGFGVKLTSFTDSQILISKKINNQKKQIFLNDQKITKISELNKTYPITWLIPEFDFIFIQEKRIRRKFFDQIISSIFPEHQSNIAKYDHYIKERIKILCYQQDNKEKFIWLNTVEEKISELINQIALTRIKGIKYLNNELQLLSGSFPKGLIFFSSQSLENNLINTPSDFLTYVRKKLFESRHQDTINKKNSLGTHKTDFRCIYIKKNIDASLCSNGEQKSLLISVFLAKINMIIRYLERKPIILIDEILSHLDRNNSYNLLQELESTECQIIVTTTEENFFTNYNNKYEISLIKI